MMLEAISYDVGGLLFTGYFADGSHGARVPGVLVIHEGGGLAAHTKARAGQLAGLGYVAFAMDLFGGPPVSPDRPETVERAKAIVQALRADVGELRARCAAALAVLEGQVSVDATRLAVIGYCFGGAAAVELARMGAPLAAVAGFHAGVLPGSAEDNKAIRGKVLLCHGADDPVVPPAQIHDFTADLSKADVDWQLHLYGGVGHSFTNMDIDAWALPGFAYHAEADRRSWAALLDLFGEAFGTG